MKALQASALPLGHVAILASSCLDKNWPVSRPVLYRQWSGQRDSNPRPSPWQGDALPAEPCPHVNLSNASLLEATPGFEPGVKALQASALPLGHVAILASSCLDKNWPVSRPVLYRQWSGQRDSNPRPSPWQGDALPAEPCPQMVGVTRFELVTSSVSGKRSPPELNAHLLCFLEPFGSIGKTLVYRNRIRCQTLFLKKFFVIFQRLPGNKKAAREPLSISWCRRRDLNPHTLKRAQAPQACVSAVPPLRRVRLEKQRRLLYSSVHPLARPNFKNFRPTQ